MYRYLTFFAFLILSLSSCGEEKQNEVPAQITDEIYSTNDGDTAMNNAIAKAKAAFGTFDEAWESGRYDASSFYIKLSYPSQSGGEHIWLSNLSAEGGNYAGVVDNTPENNIGIKQGDTIKVDNTQISDWMYADNEGYLQGGYTTRLIRDRMNDEERAAFDSQFPYKIKD